MTPTIRVDDDVFRALQEQGRAFVDTPNDVLRRVLNLDGVPLSPRLVSVPSKKLTRRRTNSRTPKAVFWVPILEILVECGGSAAVGEVLRMLREKVALGDSDFEKNPSGTIVWENRANWARFDMIQRGLLLENSPRGIWQISQEGRAYLKLSP